MIEFRKGDCVLVKFIVTSVEGDTLAISSHDGYPYGVIGSKDVDQLVSRSFQKDDAVTFVAGGRNRHGVILAVEDGYAWVRSNIGRDFYTVNVKTLKAHKVGKKVRDEEWDDD